MIQSIIHTSEKGNLYLYNDNQRLSLLIHPEFKKAHESSMNVDPYYSGKYEYLKKYGFFSEFDHANIETFIDDSMVKESIMQVPQILFEVTDCCNLKCTYCAQGELYEDSENRNSKNINIHYAIDLLKYVFNLAPQKKKDKLYIAFYGGEPLLNIKFIKQIVEVAHQLNAKNDMTINYVMTTNAILIHKYIDFLVDNKFSIMISLDGNEKNHSYRVFCKDKKNSFQKVIKNIDFIKKKYPAFFESNILFNAVIHNRNSVKEIYEFIYNRYKKNPRISELNIVDFNPIKNNIIQKMFHSKRKSETEYQNEENNLLIHNELLAYRELSDFLKHLSVNYYISNVNDFFHNDEKYLPASTCLPFSKKIFLTTCNNLLPCEKISYKYSLGKVNQNIEIDISRITRQYNLYYEHLKKQCQCCYTYRFCGLCMFHIKNLYKLESEEFVCDWFHDQITFQSKLHRVFSFLEKYPDDFFEIIEHTINIS